MYLSLSLLMDDNEFNAFKPRIKLNQSRLIS